MSPKHLARTGCGALAAAALLLLAGCGDDGGSSSADDAAAAVDDKAAPGVPEECADFMALEPASLDDVELLPADWPEPPVDATLCTTSGTLDGGQESMDYATDASPEQVLAGYEAALGEYGAQLDQDGLGRDIVVATAGDVTIQVTADDGAYSVVLVR